MTAVAVSESTIKINHGLKLRVSWFAVIFNQIIGPEIDTVSTEVQLAVQLEQFFQIGFERSKHHDLVSFTYSAIHWFEPCDKYPVDKC